MIAFSIGIRWDEPTGPKVKSAIIISANYQTIIADLTDHLNKHNIPLNAMCAITEIVPEHLEYLAHIYSDFTIDTRQVQDKIA